MYNLKNTLFFFLYLLTNIRLFKLLSKKIYLPVFIQYEWLQKYDIKTVIDVGAYHGNVALVLHSIFPKAALYVFEPSERNCQKIAAKIPSTKLVINNFALSDKKGVSNFIDYENHSLSSLLPLVKKERIYKGTSQISRSKVRTTTLDKYFNNSKIKPHIFLKIDTQGTEEQILRGGKQFLKQISIIHIEISFEEIYKGQKLFDGIYEYLRGLGFVYAGESKESHFYPIFLPANQVNAIFVNKQLLNLKYE